MIPLSRVLMKHLLVLVLVLVGLGCGSDSIRRTILPNGYALDTMGRKFGIIVRPDAPRSSSWNPVWPPLRGEEEHCGSFGWKDAWVVCEVVTYEQGSERATGQYVVLNTATGEVSVVNGRARAVELLRQASVEMPVLARDHPTTAFFFPE